MENSVQLHHVLVFSAGKCEVLAFGAIVKDESRWVIKLVFLLPPHGLSFAISPIYEPVQSWEWMKIHEIGEKTKASLQLSSKSHPSLIRSQSLNSKIQLTSEFCLFDINQFNTWLVCMRFCVP